jgi:tRNA (adenine37-N6)-methyltransferase
MSEERMWDFEFTVKVIGMLHTPFQAVEETPIQAIRSNAEGWVEVFPEYAAGLEGIEAFSHIYLLYVFHQAVETRLRVQPFLDDREHGVFATRHPMRPNHLGISVVELHSREEERLNVRGVDMLDGTPLLDIKPYVPEFDWRSGERTGWYEKRAKA